MTIKRYRNTHLERETGLSLDVLRITAEAKNKNPLVVHLPSIEQQQGCTRLHIRKYTRLEGIESNSKKIEITAYKEFLIKEGDKHEGMYYLMFTYIED